MGATRALGDAVPIPPLHVAVSWAWMGLILFGLCGFYPQHITGLASKWETSTVEAISVEILGEEGLWRWHWRCIMNPGDFIGDVLYEF